MTVFEVALTIAVPAGAYPEVIDHAEDMARAALERRYIDVQDITTDRRWADPSSWEDEDGNRHELPGYWGVFATGRTDGDPRWYECPNCFERRDDAGQLPQCIYCGSDDAPEIVTEATTRNPNR